MSKKKAKINKQTNLADSNEISLSELKINYSDKIEYVHSSQLIPFSGKIQGVEKEEKDVDVSNPFDVPDINNQEMQELRKAIDEYGVMVPLIVRKKNDSKYEILSGYRRKKVVDSINEERKANSEEEMTLPVIEVLDCDNDKAVIILATSNTHRKKISLREQIKACGLAYRAMRHQGKKAKDGHTTAEAVGQMFNLEDKTVKRYSALLNLNDELLKIMTDQSRSDDDNKNKARRRNKDGKVKLSKRAGELLVTLNKNQQNIVLKFLQDEENSSYITIDLARKIKDSFKNNHDLTLADLKEVVKDWQKKQPEHHTPERKEEKISLDSLQEYLPEKTTQEIVAQVHLFFEKWKEAGYPENFEIKAL